MRILTITLLALFTASPLAAQDGVAARLMPRGAGDRGWAGAGIGYGRLQDVDLGNGPENTNALTGYLSVGGYATPWLGVGVEIGAGLSDTHLGHANIIHHCRRPFPDAR